MPYYSTVHKSVEINWRDIIVLFRGGPQARRVECEEAWSRNIPKTDVYTRHRRTQKISKCSTFQLAVMENIQQPKSFSTRPGAVETVARADLNDITV